jgi:hypothetical protein
MPTPYENAQLNLRLFDLRREPVLREARAWFLGDFNPASLGELVALASGERNPSFRMVLGYWDMAASLVTTGAVDAEAFLAAHGEVVLAFAKVEPFLAELREAAGEPDFCRHVEAVVTAMPTRRPCSRAGARAAVAAAAARAAG